MSGLKTITIRNLALALRSLQLVVNVIPHVLIHFQKCHSERNLVRKERGSLATLLLELWQFRFIKNRDSDSSAVFSNKTGSKVEAHVASCPVLSLFRREEPKDALHTTQLSIYGYTLYSSEIGTGIRIE